jgi:dTDP-4-dehydrorhamnose 3,5-epimerase
MIFTETKLTGVWLIEPERRGDERGYLARTFCAEEFSKHGLPIIFPQCNTTYNARRGTLRGMHWQAEPRPEGKLVRCTRGAIFDVAVDLRPSKVPMQPWVGAVLSAGNGHSLYIPPGCAHGYQTLTDDTEIYYQMSENYVPDLARGARWDDPAFAIDWPLPYPALSDRDRQHPLWPTATI